MDANDLAGAGAYGQGVAGATLVAAISSATAAAATSIAASAATSLSSIVAEEKDENEPLGLTILKAARGDPAARARLASELPALAAHAVSSSGKGSLLDKRA